MALIFKDSIIYLIAIYGSKLLSFISKIIIARILGPRDYGLWNILSLILSYGGFLHLGLVYALVKEVSFYRGKSRSEEVDEIKNTVFSSLIIISSLSAVIMLFASIILYGIRQYIVFSLIAFILILQQIRNYFLYNFFAEKQFVDVNKLIMWSTFLFSIPTIILVIKFGFVGLPLGITLGHLLVLLYIFNRYKPALKFQINMKRFFSLVKIGLPIMFIFLIYNIFLTLDRILIFKFMGKMNLGYYGIASALTGLVILFPASFGILIFPRISEKYGAVGEPKVLENFIKIPTIVMAYFISVISGLIYLFLPIAIKIFLPQYIPGITVGRIALLGIMFLSVSVFAQKLLITINLQIGCLFIALSALVLKTILTYIFISKHMGIEGVAIAANIVYFVYSAFIIMYASHCCKNNFLKSFKYIIKVYLPFVYLLLILFCFNYFKQLPILNIENKIIRNYINYIILIIFVIVPFGCVIKKNLSIYFQKVSKTGTPQF